jgi:predicted permease
MRAMRRFWKRLCSLAVREKQEERLRAEIEQHLALQGADYVRAGLSPAEARRQAALQFGGVEAMKESYREQRGFPLLESLILDIRYAARRLRMAPAFTLATVLTLALGIGATTSIFTLAHAVLLKSLPVANPGELYRLGKESNCCYVGGYSQDGEFSLVSYDLYKSLRDHTRGFSELAAFPAPESQFGVRRAGSPEAAQSYPGEFVSGNYFTMFGVGAYAGRVLTAKDDHPGAPPVAVMSYRLWEQTYGSDPSVIGSVYNLDGKPVTVVGIAPPGFFGDTLRTTPPDFFLPLNAEPVLEVDADLNKYDTHWLELIGRISPGANPMSIEAQMRLELKQWLRAHWSEMSAQDRAAFPEQTLYLRPGGGGMTAMRDRYEHWLRILMVITGFVLLIVCANLANLMLVRGLEGRRQTSLSMALGARPARLVRAPLIDSILLSLLGGTAGLALAFAGTRLILHFAFPSVPGLAGVPIDASPSLPVLAFASAASLLTGIFFGIAPAWMATRVDPIEALRGASRSTARAGSFPRKTLVAVQVALSLVLLSASGLLTAALQRLEHQDFGFALDGRLEASINPRLAGYRTDQLHLLYGRLHDAVAALPGVSSVALCLHSPPTGGGYGMRIWVDGHPVPAPTDDISATFDRVTPAYFGVIGTPILRGRAISEQDTASSPQVVVVNQAFARRFFGTEDPIGKRFGGPVPALSRAWEVVGVVRDARYLGENLAQPVRPFFFLPEMQAPYQLTNVGSLFLHDIVIMTRPGAGVSVPQLLRAIASVDPNLPVPSIRTFREEVAGQFTQQRLIARLTSFFGILSLVLASVGLYGVIAYNAGRRVGEIGVRVALGADRRDIVRLVLRGAFGMILVGLLLGLPLALAAGRFLGSQLYGLNPYDPVVMATAVLALGVAALPASLVPAYRASRMSLLDALRTE